MTLLKPFALGADGQIIPGRLMRIALGSTFRPAAAGVSAISGVLYGPAGTMGEGTLLSNTQLSINPFVAVVQGTQQGNQGQYVIPNDGAVTLGVTAQHASQWRRSLVVVRAADSQAAGVASTATTDNSFLELVDGALSASAPGALPAVPANALSLGELGIPPAGQAVTWTPYNPRTTTRGGILPVINDTSTIAGHAGAAPVHDGQYRDHPVRGLQRGVGGAWARPSGMEAAVTYSTRAAALAAGFSDAYAAGTISAVNYRLLGGGLIFLNVAFTQTRASYTPTAEGGHGDVDLFSVPAWMNPAYAVPGFDNTIRGAFYLLFTSGVFTHTASATSATWTAGDAHSVRGVYMLENDPA